MWISAVDDRECFAVGSSRMDNIQGVERQCWLNILH